MISSLLSVDYLKALALVACLFASTAFAQEIVINGVFPPRDSSEVEIIYPDGWKEERYEGNFGAVSEVPMSGVKLRFKGERGKEHEVWVYFSTERGE
jgi:hypothetical protein